jgi:hypothetical protein
MAGDSGAMPLEEAHFWIALTIFGAGVYLVRDEPLWGGPLVAVGIIWLIYALRHHFAPKTYKFWIVLFAMCVATGTTGADLYQRYFIRPTAQIVQPKVRIVNYGIDGPQQFHAIVEIPNWQEYKDFKGVLITRVQYGDRDRMNDDWIAKSIAYTMDGPTLTTVAITKEQMRFALGMLNMIEYTFVVIPSDKAPEQIRMLGDVAKLGGKILSTVGQGVPIAPAPPVPVPSAPH